MPTANQELVAAVNAAAEEYVSKHRKQVLGGHLVPSSEDLHRHLARKFCLYRHQVRAMLTWSRICAHPWSEGACDDCPGKEGDWC